MSIELEIHNIIRSAGTVQEKADRICKITTLDRDKVIKGIEMGEKSPAEIYLNIVNLHPEIYKKEMIK